MSHAAMDRIFSLRKMARMMEQTLGRMARVHYRTNYATLQQLAVTMGADVEFVPPDGNRMFGRDLRTDADVPDGIVYVQTESHVQTGIPVYELGASTELVHFHRVPVVVFL